MITNKTVFILGAGASQPFGYPTGRELRDNILTNLMSPHQANNICWKNRYDRFSKLGFTEKDISKFRDEFSRSTLYSIDAFLENRPDFNEIGKIAIADTLIPYEDEGRLFATEKNWYSYLFNRMIPGCTFEKFAENKIAFITFNYDRSLEHYLYNALKNTYDKQISEVTKALNAIEILHVYGQLSFLPWQDTGGQAYEGKRAENPDYLKQSANMIRIVHENVDVNSDNVFVRAHKLLREAKNIFFLGFGYYETNLDRLKMKDFIMGRDVMGTSLNLEPSKQRDVNRYFQGKGTIRMSNKDTLAFLHDQIDILWS